MIQNLNGSQRISFSWRTTNEKHLLWTTVNHKLKNHLFFSHEGYSRVDYRQFSSQFPKFPLKQTVFRCNSHFHSIYMKRLVFQSTVATCTAPSSMRISTKFGSNEWTFKFELYSNYSFGYYPFLFELLHALLSFI